MTFNETDLQTLSAWENNFETAVKADWTRNPGREALRAIHGIFTAATGDTRRLNDGCQHCILELVRDCGRLYFADKAALADQHNDAKCVELSEKEMNTAKKVKVSTKGKK